ncbi:MAG: hypothetical protein ACJ8CB_16200 [Ktedonobacteraceae bacterium]
MAQPILLHPMRVSLIPLVRGKGASPLWGNFCQDIERGTHGFAPSSHPIDRAHRGPHMGRIRALPPPSFDEPLLLEGVEHGLEQQILHLPFDKPCAELREHGKIKALILSREAQSIFPIEMASYRIGSLTVG